MEQNAIVFLPIGEKRFGFEFQLVDGRGELIEHMAEILDSSILIDDAECRGRGSHSATGGFQGGENLLFRGDLVFDFLDENDQIKQRMEKIFTLHLRRLSFAPASKFLARINSRSDVCSCTQSANVRTV